MKYLAIECPASREEWSVHAVQGLTPTDVYDAALAAARFQVAADYDAWEAYVVPGEHADVAAAVLVWGETRHDIDAHKPVAKGQYRYDADGVAPVSVGVVMLKEGGK